MFSGRFEHTTVPATTFSTRCLVFLGTGRYLAEQVYAVAGTAAGSFDNESPPLYNCSSFLRQFDEVSRMNGGAGPSWRWYSSDPSTLRPIDSRYSLEVSDRFAHFDWSTMIQRRTFLHDVAARELPSFS